jgi:eukaryotic-like serine/threonine-protein kinase
LSYAHRQHVIHRDIKPANMMLTPEGVVKLMDFGIARSGTDRSLTMTGTTMGSLYYMSPEQVKGQPTDARSDLYSVGVSLYEMVTGERPFRADSDYSLMVAHVQQPPKPPIELQSHLPTALNEIILTSIAKDPDQRFQSADAFRNALNSVRGVMPTGLTANPTAVGARISPYSATALLQTPAVSAASIHEASTPPLEAPLPQPQRIPSVLELSAQQKSHRGLYMSLGALIVLAVLVVAGIYVPRRAKTSAKEPNAQQGNPTTSPADSTSSGNSAGGETTKAQPTDSTSTSSQTADTGNASTTNPATQGSGDAQPVGRPADAGNSAGVGATGADTKQTDQNQQIPTPQGEKPDKRHSPHKNPIVIPASGLDKQDLNVAQDSPTLPATSSQLEELEKQADVLSSQASSVNDSLDNLRRLQSSQGLSLRGDISSTQELMKTHLAKAQTALQNRDATGAKRYLDLAEGDVAKLDKFLGR